MIKKNFARNKWGLFLFVILLFFSTQFSIRPVMAQTGATATHTDSPRGTAVPTQAPDSHDNNDDTHDGSAATATATAVFRPLASATPTRVTAPLFSDYVFRIGVSTAESDSRLATQQLKISNPIPGYDIKITHVEITQGIQNLDNDMPLVAQRDTLVRVYISITDMDFEEVEPGLTFAGFYVKGAMFATSNTNIPAYPAQIESKGAIIFNEWETDNWDSLSHRAQYNATVNFALPNYWTLGNYDYEILVWGDSFEKFPLGIETDFANNKYVLNADYQTVPAPEMIVYAMHNHFGADSEQPVADPIINTELLRDDLVRYFPIHDVVIWTSPLFYLKPFGHPNDAHKFDWTPNKKGGINAEVAALAWIKNNSGGYPKGDVVIWYGLIASGVPLKWWNTKNEIQDIAGLASGGVAVGISGPTVSHEAGHTFGLHHILCEGKEAASGPIDPDFPYPFPNCSLWEIDIEGFYGITERSSPPNSYVVYSNDPAGEISLSPYKTQPGFPLMSYMGPPWIDPLHYCKAFNVLGGDCPFSAIGLADLNNQHIASLYNLPPLHGGENDAELPVYLIDAKNYLMVSGYYSLNDNSAGFFQSQVISELTDNAWQTATETESERKYQLENDLISPYRVALLDDAGSIIFDLALFDNNYLSTHESGESISFFEVLPFDENSAKLVVMDDVGTLITQQEVSNNAPTVTFTYPTVGGEVTLPLELAWEAQDADGDDLSYMIQYSSDNGETWLTLISQYPETSALLDETAGLESSPQGIFRVVASDGLLTGSDMLDEPLTLPNNPPLVYIHSLDEGTVFPTNARVTLRGIAQDWEDGEILSENLVWMSNIDGKLGSGTEIIKYDLSAGVHEITLIAADLDGAQNSTVIHITIDPDSYDDSYDPELLDWARAVLDGEIILETYQPEIDLVDESTQVSESENGWSNGLLVGIGIGLLILAVVWYWIVRKK